MPETNTNSGTAPIIETAPQTVAPAVQPVATPAPVVPQAPVFPQMPYYQAPIAPQIPQATPNTDNERTREQFEKLLESNSKLFQANESLRQELEKRATANEQFKPIQQPPVQTPVVQETVNPSDFIEVDPVTGERFINEGRLKARMEEINSKTSRLEQVIQQYTQTAEQREIERQEREAFAVYPELDVTKRDTFNPRFSNSVRAAIYDSLINPQDYGGRPLNFKEAADFIRAQNPQTQLMQGETQPNGGQTPAQVQEQSQAAQDLKAQASAGAVGQQPMERASDADYQDLEFLRRKTRQGDPEALARRLFAVEHSKKSSEAS